MALEKGGKVIEGLAVELELKIEKLGKACIDLILRLSRNSLVDRSASVQKFHSRCEVFSHPRGRRLLPSRLPKTRNSLKNSRLQISEGIRPPDGTHFAIWSLSARINMAFAGPSRLRREDL